MTGLRFVLLACVLASLACDAKDPPRTRELASTAPPQLSKEPILRIGIEGEPDYEFSQIANATRRSDGTIVVADRGSTSIRFYDAKGELIRRVGRQGEGPGEYRMLGDVVPLERGFLVSDWRLMRYSLLDDRGKFRYTVADPASPIVNDDDVGRRYPYSRFRFTPLGELNGQIVMRRLFHPTYYQTRYAEGVIFRDTIKYVLAEVPRSDGGTLRVTDSIAEALSKPTARRSSVSPSGFRIQSSRAIPFSPSSSYAIASDRLYIADADSFVVRRYSAKGERLPDIRGPSVDSEPVTEADLSQLRRHLGGMNTDERGRKMPDAGMQRYVNWFMTNVPIEKTKPVRGRLIADGYDNLWVQDYSLEDDSRFFTVFNKDGKLLGRIELPPGLYVLEIGRDYLLGVATDELDVQTVVLYKLSFPAAKN